MSLSSEQEALCPPEVSSDRKRLTPRLAIHAYCREWCSLGSSKEAKLCEAAECPLWTRRHSSLGSLGRGGHLKAMRKRCLDCCTFNAAEVTRCAIADCILHPYRMGKRPKQSNDLASPRPDTPFLAANPTTQPLLALNSPPEGQRQGGQEIGAETPLQRGFPA